MEQLKMIAHYETSASIWEALFGTAIEERDLPFSCSASAIDAGSIGPRGQIVVSVGGALILPRRIFGLGKERSEKAERN